MLLDAIIDGAKVMVMAQLIVRNLEPKIVEKLKVRAARRRRSAEAEHREILRQALSVRSTAKTLKERLLEIRRSVRALTSRGRTIVVGETALELSRRYQCPVGTT